MQREDDLEDRERNEQEKRSDECELHDGTPAVLPEAGEQPHGPDTLLMARSRTLVRASSATSHKAVTSPAVMTATRTQPGTSPLSLVVILAMRRVRVV
jgi:hypothetical protein